MFREMAMTRRSSIVATLALTVAMLMATPLVAQTTMPTPEGLTGMSAEAKAVIKDDVMAAAREQPDQVTKQPMPDMPDAPVLLARGALRDADRIHKGSGSAGLYQLPDGGYLLRLQDFRTTNGPDLRVLLVENADPQSRGDIKAGFLDLGALKGNVGNQNYVIPADADVSRFASVVIYCRAFSVLFSVAPLIATG